MTEAEKPAPVAEGDADIDVTVTDPEGDDAAEAAFLEEAGEEPRAAQDDDAPAPEKPAEPKASKLLRWQEKNRKVATANRVASAKLASERAAFDAERAKFAKRLELADAFEKDPFEALPLIGKSFDDLTTAKLAQGKPLTAAQLEERLARDRAEREKLQTETRDQSQSQQRAAVERAFADSLTEEQHPAIFGWAESQGGPAVVLRDAHLMADKLRAAGLPFGLADVADALESTYRTRIESAARRLGAKGLSALQNGTSARQTEPVKQAKPGAPRGASPRTLTSSQAGERAGTRRITDEEAEAEFLVENSLL